MSALAPCHKASACVRPAGIQKCGRSWLLQCAGAATARDTQTVGVCAVRAAARSFVFNFASKAAQLQRTLVYDLLGLPRDLLFRYRDGVARVAREDVLGAAQRHLHPTQQVLEAVLLALQCVLSFASGVAP